LRTAVADWTVGDRFQAADGRHLRIVAIVPTERISEFVDGPVYALWKVERAADLDFAAPELPLLGRVDQTRLRR
jgi:hypothetical protein